MRNICIFAGGAQGRDPAHIKAAREVGGMVAARGFGVIYGGGGTGLMGALADGALEAGGHVHGVMPRFLTDAEVAHQKISKLTITETMPERKAVMYDASCAFITLPGGVGTLEEMLEVISQRQLKIHDKPICVFSHRGFWREMLAAFDAARDAGFIRQNRQDLFEVAENIAEMGDFIDGLAPGGVLAPGDSAK